MFALKNHTKLFYDSFKNIFFRMEQTDRHTHRQTFRLSGRLVHKYASIKIV